MQSTATTVDDYLQEVPIERRDALTRLRDLCRTRLAGFEESMKYGMPGYLRNGEVEVGFASQKNYIALYILKADVMDAHRDLLNMKGVSLGKGCIRYSKPERIDFAVVESLLNGSLQSTSAICA